MEELPKINSVRAMIDLFEDNCKNETALRLNRKLSKSFAGLSFTERKLKSSSTDDNDLLYHLEQRLTSVSLKLKGYIMYAKETHIAIQDELIEIVKILINIDTKNNTLMFRKKELMYVIKEHFYELSTRLPAASDKIRQGFGDTSYKPFSWRRPNSVSGVSLNAKGSTPTNENTLSPKGVKPQRSQSVVERYIQSIQEHSRNVNVKKTSRDSLQESPDFVIGGTGGIRRPEIYNDLKRTDQSPDVVIGGAGGIRRPVNSSNSSSPLSKSPEIIIGGQAGVMRQVNTSRVGTATDIAPAGSNDDVELRTKQLQSSASQVLPHDEVKRPVTIGRSESAKRWTYGELRGRRRPVSLGGTVVTLNSPENIISSVNFSSDSPYPSERVSEYAVAEGDKQEFENYEVVDDDYNLQSVNILKRFFELKSDERENWEKQNSLNANEDQGQYFLKNVQSIEKYIEDEDNQYSLLRENSADDSSNNTIVEVEVEEDEFGDSKRVVLTRASSIRVDEVEEVNNPVLRSSVSQEVDEVIVTTTVREDVEEAGSYSSEQSIYLDPVD